MPDPIQGSSPTGPIETPSSSSEDPSHSPPIQSIQESQTLQQTTGGVIKKKKITEKNQPLHGDFTNLTSTAENIQQHLTGKNAKRTLTDKEGKIKRSAIRKTVQKGGKKLGITVQRPSREISRLFYSIIRPEKGETKETALQQTLTGWQHSVMATHAALSFFTKEPLQTVLSVFPIEHKQLPSDEQGAIDWLKSIADQYLDPQSADYTQIQEAKSLEDLMEIFQNFEIPPSSLSEKAQHALTFAEIQQQLRQIGIKVKEHLPDNLSSSKTIEKALGVNPGSFTKKDLQFNNYSILNALKGFFTVYQEQVESIEENCNLSLKEAQQVLQQVLKTTHHIKKDPKIQTLLHFEQVLTKILTPLQQEKDKRQSVDLPDHKTLIKECTKDFLAPSIYRLAPLLAKMDPSKREKHYQKLAKKGLLEESIQDLKQEVKKYPNDHTNLKNLNQAVNKASNQLQKTHKITKKILKNRILSSVEDLNELLFFVSKEKELACKKHEKSLFKNQIRIKITGGQKGLSTVRVVSNVIGKGAFKTVSFSHNTVTMKQQVYIEARNRGAQEIAIENKNHRILHNLQVRNIPPMIDSNHSGSVGIKLDKTGKDDDLSQEELMLFAQAGFTFLQDTAKHNIIHHDIKPDNMMLGIDPETRKQQAYMIDFGLMQNLEKDSVSTSSIGTPLYLAPEKYSENRKNTPQGDLYSFSRSLYDMFYKQQGSLPPSKLWKHHVPFIQEFSIAIGYPKDRVYKLVEQTSKEVDGSFLFDPEAFFHALDPGNPKRALLNIMIYKGLAEDPKERLTPDEGLEFLQQIQNTDGDLTRGAF